MTELNLTDALIICYLNSHNFPMRVDIVLKPFVPLKKQKPKEVTYSIISTYNLKDYILLAIAL